MPTRLHVRQCDNRLRVLINGLTVYDKYFDDKYFAENPGIEDVIELDAWLRPHPFVNKLRIQGFNGATLTHQQFNSWSFHYLIERDGVVEIEFQHHDESATEAFDRLMLDKKHTLVLPSG